MAGASVDDSELEFEFDFLPRAGTVDEREASEPDREDTMPARPGRRARSRPARPPAQVVMRRRIAALAVVGLALLIVVLVVLTGGSSGQGGAFRTYLSGLGQVASDSQQTGGSLSQLLTTSSAGSAKAGLLANLDGLVQREVTEIGRLQALSVPAPLRSEQEQALAALDLRVRGLQGLRDTLAQALKRTDGTAWAPVVSAQIEDLVTSDVIWSNAVRGGISDVMQAKGIPVGGVPGSRFVTDEQALSEAVAKLVPSATVSAATANAPTATTPSALKLGDKGAAVASWQTQLNQWLKRQTPAQTALVPDGTFGPATQTATQALQTAQGITPDGTVGPATRTALQQALARRTG